MRTQKIFGFAMAAALALSANQTLADSSASAPTVGGTQSSTASAAYNAVKKNLRANYIMELSGPNMKSLSGSIDPATGAHGDTAIQMIHYFNVGYKVGQRWTIGVTQPFTQIIDETPAAQSDPFFARDPYITFSNNRLLKIPAANFGMTGYFRYYAPLSQSSISKINRASPDEYGRGQVRVVLIPTFAWLDGSLSLAVQNLFHYRFAARDATERTRANGNPYRNDMQYVFDPVLRYDLTDTISPYMEYAFVLTHNTSGHWGSYKNTHSVSPGVNWQATKKLYVNPYVDFKPKFSEFTKASVGLNIVYALL